MQNLLIKNSINGVHIVCWLVEKPCICKYLQINRQCWSLQQLLCCYWRLSWSFLVVLLSILLDKLEVIFRWFMFRTMLSPWWMYPLIINKWSILPLINLLCLMSMWSIMCIATWLFWVSCLLTKFSSYL